MEQGLIRTGKTKVRDPELALQELARDLRCKEAKFTLIFFHPELDLISLAPLLEKYCGNNVIACSSAGEISEQGYEKASIVGISFSGAEFEVQCLPLQNLNDLDLRALHGIVAAANEAAEAAYRSRERQGPAGHSLAVLLIDGLCGKEEMLTAAIYDALGNIPLIGGSTGDGLSFGKTQFYFRGKILDHGGAVILLTTTVPFSVFRFQHFAESAKKLVITRSDPARRLVYEIDGEPAAIHYAQILNLKVEDLNPEVYSRFPLLLKIRGEYYFRSIQKRNDDNSLTFYCAIDNGLVLTLASRKENHAEIKSAFEEFSAKFDSIYGSIFFECVLRRLEVQGLREEQQKAINDLFREMKPVGFHSYGEQIDSLHVNQTLTGVAFGRKK